MFTDADANRLYERLTHKTITHRDVNKFAWCESRKEALNQAAKLMAQGKAVYIGGKRGKNRWNYHDIRMAAIIHNDQSASDKPWVVAWHD